MLLNLLIVSFLILATTATLSKINIPGVGPIDGLILQTPNTRKSYYQYLGIKYGKAKRFELAQLADPWTLPYDCTKEGNVCPQFTGDIQHLGGISEDCLVLTVTTPLNPNDHPNPELPVLVFIYGGAFLLGTSKKSTYDPQYLVQEDIIIVQPNYRLGAFGWVTDGEIIPHNIALKDIRAALLWIQKYIQYFGGNSDLVTIYGESAGSVLANSLWHAHHRLPPNLFRAVFMQSGQVIAPFALQKDPHTAYMNVLKKTTCRSTINQSPTDQVACLKSLTYQELSIQDLLTLGVNGIIENTIGTKAFNAAVVMEDSNDPDALIVEPPLEQLQRGNICTNISIMISNTNYEIFSFGPVTEIFRFRTNNQVVPEGMQPVDPNMVGGIIKTYYAQSELLWAIQPETTYIEVANDIAMFFPARHFIDLVQPHLDPNVNMYVMEFAYVSPMGRFNDKICRVGHADDLIYTWIWEALTQESILAPTYPAEVWKKRAQFNRMLCNFVKYLDPTPPDNDILLDGIIWPPVTNTLSVDYLRFDKVLTIEQNPQNENIEFWRQLYTNYSTGKISL